MNTILNGQKMRLIFAVYSEMFDQKITNTPLKYSNIDVFFLHHVFKKILCHVSEARQ